MRRYIYWLMGWEDEAKMQKSPEKKETHNSVVDSFEVKPVVYEEKEYGCIVYHIEKSAIDGGEEKKYFAMPLNYTNFCCLKFNWSPRLLK